MSKEINEEELIMDHSLKSTSLNIISDINQIRRLEISKQILILVTAENNLGDSIKAPIIRGWIKDMEREMESLEYN